ncbi:hypothetical protein KKA00_06385 [bacterium]|nr:hypothetical protein [bacterium]
MALYDLEVTEAPNSKKGLKLISSISGFSERDLEEQLPLGPIVIMKSVSLSEAIETDRQLKLLSVKTRLLRAEEKAEFDFEEDDDVTLDEQRTEAIEDVLPFEDVIEIPDDEIKILLPEDLAAITADYTTKKSRFSNSWFSWLAIIFVIAVVSFGTWYLLFQKTQANNQVEIELHINQWLDTAQRQDYLLDKGFSPERIFYKLDELDAKVNSLLAVYRPVYKANQIRSDFNRQKVDNYDAIKDLAFRKSLEDNGYSIHPVCILENGQVRGSTELPESSLLRIKLLGQANIESVYYAARVSGGMFKLIIDSGLTKYVYDAKATVAPYSQQPRELQRWSERKFQLTDFCNSYLPRAPRKTRYPDLIDSGVSDSSTAIQETSSSSEEPLQPMTDPGTDRLRVEELKTNFTEWTTTILDAQQEDLAGNPSVLEQIYQRLLLLENRINQLTGMLESPSDRNIWSEKREETFGAYIDLRQNIADAYMAKHRITDPLQLEGIFLNRFSHAGFPNAEILVVESPENPQAFVVEIDIFAGKANDVYVALARVISQELQNSDIKINHIKLRHGGTTLRWDVDQVLSAAAELNKIDGVERCFSRMEITASFQGVP